jgi:GDP-L-fucose synthase
LQSSHVIPALIKKFHEAMMHHAPEVIVWGTGKALREFMHVDDLADACLFLMNNYSEQEFVNIGTGQELTIHELALMIKDIVGFKGEIAYDKSKPDGTPRKLLDVNKIKTMGWKYSIDLKEGLKDVYQKNFPIVA